jgi:hypothetical protein
MDAHDDSGWFRSVRKAFVADDLRDPPDWVRTRASESFRTRAARVPRTLIERVRAALIFDSRQSALAHMGVRSATALVEGPWQLLFRGGDVDIDLLVRPNQDGRTLNVRGQALSLGGATIDPGVVEALRVDPAQPLHGSVHPSARSEVEPTGEFALPNLERGKYDVLVRFGEREIELSNLEL